MVLIGFVEGFISPGPFFPWPLKLAVGLLTGVGLWRWLLTSGKNRAVVSGVAETTRAP
jgi:hypothetical protein